MRRFVRVVAGCLLIAAAAGARAQAVYDRLPPHLRGPWMDQQAVFGTYEASLEVPEGWSIRESGIDVSPTETPICRIDFVPTPGIYKDALARELVADREAARYAVRSELCCGGGRQDVTVRYTSPSGQTIEKRYFELPSPDGGELMTWMVAASRTREGEQCVQRFRMVADSLSMKSRRPVDGDPADDKSQR